MCSQKASEEALRSSQPVQRKANCTHGKKVQRHVSFCFLTMQLTSLSRKQRPTSHGYPHSPLHLLSFSPSSENCSFYLLQASVGFSLQSKRKDFDKLVGGSVYSSPSVCEHKCLERAFDRAQPNSSWRLSGVCRL